MRRAVGLAALIMLSAVLAPSAWAQNPKDTITGTPPFSLGMTASDALAAAPGLAPITTTACGTPAPGPTYGTRVTAPLAGYPYTASVILCFVGSQLGAIYLTWPAGTFQEDNIRWQLATRGLAGQLAAAYAPGLVKRYAVNEDMGGVVEMGDGQGNLLTMASNPGDDPDIRVSYVSAAYDQAMNGKRITLTTY